MACSSASAVLALAARRSRLSLDEAFSMGLRSGGSFHASLSEPTRRARCRRKSFDLVAFPQQNIVRTPSNYKEASVRFGLSS